MKPSDSPAWLLSLDRSQPWRGVHPHGLSVATGQRRWAAIRGRLYDTHTLVRELDAAEPAASDPARLVLAGFERWGPGVLDRLRGVFVVALGDEDAREVIVARDPLGSHPLFRAETEDRHVFAESIHDVRSVVGVSTTLNRAALADHLCHRWPSPTETFFEAIYRIPPGCAATIGSGALRVTRYWDPAMPGQPFRWTGDDVSERFPKVFARAVDRCLDAGPAAIFLSGGLDSISVAACAADRARERHDQVPWALSLAMPDPDCDERETQVAIASTLELPQRLVDFDEAVGPGGLIAAGIDLGRGLSSPLLNIWGPAYLSLAKRAAADGVRTVLSGSGGDEWLSVSPYLSADLLARGDLRGWWQYFQSFKRSYQHPLWRHVSLTAWTFGARPLLSQALSRAMPQRWQRRRESRAAKNDPPWVAPEPALRRVLRERSARSLENVDPPQGFYLREVRSGLDHALTSWELEEQFEFGRRTELQFLHPYWDADVVDMLYRTPPRLLIEGGRAKGLVRRGLAQRFPEAGLGGQRKVAGTGFYRHLVATQLPPAAATVGDCHCLADLGIITADAARGYLKPGFGSPTNRWDVISLETWVRANTQGAKL